ncbi:DUF1684 domain-containing protein [Bacteroidota bacterium]
MKASINLFLLLAIILLSSCTQKAPIIEDWDAYISAHEEWQLNRLERLKSERGWMNLAGLYWLEEGENTFGSDPSNDIVFPEKFPSFGGRIILQDSLTALLPDSHSGITVEGESVSHTVLMDDQQKYTTTMEQGSFRWFIIKRGTKYGIRLRDLEHPRLAELDHIPAYPFSQEWVIRAKFIPYDSVKTIEVPTVIEDFYEYYKVPGEVHFKVNGKKQTLLPFASGKGFFFIVGDATNGLETYGAGRFLYVPEVKEDSLIIDFNKAYNPPCAFSPFATCPLPPLDNILDIEISAGEKGVHLE